MLFLLSVTPRDANDDDGKLKFLKKGNLSKHLMIFQYYSIKIRRIPNTI